MASLREQVLRRKPVTVMTEGDRGRHRGRRARALDRAVPAVAVRHRRDDRHRHLHRAHAGGAGRGPAVILSFVIAGVVAGLTASATPSWRAPCRSPGSSYSYAYATLGEGVAIVVRACLLLEYGVSAAAVAPSAGRSTSTSCSTTSSASRSRTRLAKAPEQDGVFNLPAVILIVLCALLLIRGASESAKVNAVMVLIKLGVLVLFIVVGLAGLGLRQPVRLRPVRGRRVTSAAAGIIFFSYIGLDAVSTAGEEVKNPRRNLPLAIIIALVTVTTLYIAVAIVAVAAQPVAEFEGQEAGLSAILEDVTGRRGRATVLAAGAVISIFSVTLVVIYGQTRILFAMGRDGMTPPFFHKLNPRTLTPVPATIIVAVAISILAGVLPIDFLAEMTSIGTLVGVPDRLDRRDGAATDRARPAARLQGPALPA